MDTFFDSPSLIRRFLQDRGLGARKRWGQNFLINPRTRERIWKALEVPSGGKVWEIGPGLGAMTDLIIKAGHPLTAFEIDPAYCEILEKEFGAEGFTLIAGDVLKTWKEHTGGGMGWILGNLPYNIAGMLLGDWAEHGANFPAGVFLVQKELAQRMTAKPRTKPYSNYSVLTQSAYSVKILFDVSPGNFYPSPEVTSTAIRIEPLHGAISDPVGYAKFLRVCFSVRRKTLRNNVALAGKAGWNAEGLVFHMEKHGMDLGKRPEEFEPQVYRDIWNNPNMAYHRLHGAGPS